jgi:hypothetical protein
MYIVCVVESVSSLTARRHVIVCIVFIVFVRKGGISDLNSIYTIMGVLSILHSLLIYQGAEEEGALNLYVPEPIGSHVLLKTA